jgi:hypothetical protein
MTKMQSTARSAVATVLHCRKKKYGYEDINQTTKFHLFFLFLFLLILLVISSSTALDFNNK